MENKGNYGSISLRDVLWKFVEGWKLVLICVIAGLLVSVLYVRRNYDSLQQDYRLKKLQSEATWKEYYDEAAAYADYNDSTTSDKSASVAKMQELWKSKLTREQIEAVENVIGIKKQMNDLSRYMKDSILMNLDPYNVGTLYMVFELSNESGSYGNLLTAYTGYATGIDFTKTVAQENGFAVDGYEDIVYNELLTSTALNGSQFHVTYQYNDTATLEKIANTITKLIEGKRPELAGKFGEHSIKCVESVVSIKSNAGLGNTKNSYQQSITNYNNQINTNKNNFAQNAAQLNLYNSLADIEDGGTGAVTATLPAEPKVEEPKTLRSKTVYYIVGIMVGALLALAIIYLKILFSTKLQKADELESIYGLKLLGTMPYKRMLPMDRWIYSIKNRKQAPKDIKEQISMASEFIAGNCGEKNIKKLAIVGTASIGKDEAAINNVIAGLKEKGINAVYSGDINRDRKAVDSVVNSDGAIIVEKTGKSVYRLINSECGKLAALSKPVVGAIGLE